MDRRVRAQRCAGRSSIGEVAASVVLICGAALLFKSLAKLQQVDAGVRIDHVITMSTDLPSAAYPTPASATRLL